MILQSVRQLLTCLSIDLSLESSLIDEIGVSAQGLVQFPIPSIVLPGLTPRSRRESGFI